MNKLECQLNCKATACCENTVAEDLKKEDKPLEELLGDTNAGIESEVNESQSN